MKKQLLMLVPLARVEWAVQRGDEESTRLLIDAPPDKAEMAARALAREMNEKSDGRGWHTLVRIRETDWARR